MRVGGRGLGGCLGGSAEGMRKRWVRGQNQQLHNKRYRRTMGCIRALYGRYRFVDDTKVEDVTVQ